MQKQTNKQTKIFHDCPVFQIIQDGKRHEILKHQHHRLLSGLGGGLSFDTKHFRQFRSQDRTGMFHDRQGHSQGSRPQNCTHIEDAFLRQQPESHTRNKIRNNEPFLSLLDYLIVFGRITFCTTLYMRQIFIFTPVNGRTRQ